MEAGSSTAAGTVSAALEGVTVNGNGTGIIDVGTTGPDAALLRLDDGTTVKNAELVIADGSTVDVESRSLSSGEVNAGASAALNGVTVDGTDGSIIDVGTTGPDAVILVLDGGTTITNGDLTIAAGSTVEITGSTGATPSPSTTATRPRTTSG